MPKLVDAVRRESWPAARQPTRLDELLDWLGLTFERD
jgi:hypothetical protein